ncbi:MAG: D-glucuronyl C5-epimerase family protein, partial [Candidatus Thorarchaeota archaeon]
MSELKELLTKSIDLLDQWITKNGWKGYDPYDLQCAFALHKYSEKHPRIKRLHAYLFSRFNRYIPIFSRKFFRVKKQINAKGMGLFTSAYCKLFQITKNDNYLNKAIETAEWLLENPNKNYENLCWGYPFDWQSLIFLPKGTPSGVATSHIGHGFWDLYQITKDQKYLDACESICEFFLTSLNRSENKNGFCFSYTPLDDFQVHNANLFVAEFIVRIGNILNREEWIKIGLDAANFSLKEQLPNGSLCYWSQNYGEKKNIPCRNDHYHSGFEIRMFYNIWKWTNDKKYKTAVEKYFDYYWKNYFSKEFAPILSPTSGFTIEVHACAEALILNSILSGEFPKAKEILLKTAEWIIPNMQRKEGWFRYRLAKGKGKIKTIDVPYIRWGQAWMLYGLSY